MVNTQQKNTSVVATILLAYLKYYLIYRLWKFCVAISNFKWKIDVDYLFGLVIIAK